MTTAIKPPRSVASDVSLTVLGLINMPVDLLPIRRGSAVELKMVCPTCDEAHLAEQRYHCSHDDTHGPFVQADMHRGIVVDKELKKLTPEEIEELKEPTIEPGEATFDLFPADEIAAHCIPSGNVFRVRPHKGKKDRPTPPQYALLVDMVREIGVATKDRPALAPIAEFAMRGVQKMYRLEVRDDNLLMVELARPGELHDGLDLRVDYDDGLLDLTLEKAQMEVKAFDPDTYANQIRQRAEELRERKADPNAPAPAPVVKEAPVDNSTTNLAAALQASIDSAKAKTKARASRSNRGKRKAS